MSIRLRIDDRDAEIVALARYFDYEHLPAGPLRSNSIQCHDLASYMINELPDCPELTAGLRKLLEAKDCFVRAALEL